MIFDNIKNCEIYYGMNPKFKKAFEFINRAIKEGLDKGKYEIEGNEVYAIVQKYQTGHKDIKKFEGHKKYIDIQCMLNGIEIIGMQKISDAVILTEYNDEKDAAIYSRSNNAFYCIAKKGDFCIFYPDDIHSPGSAFDSLPTEVEKIVVKIRI